MTNILSNYNITSEELDGNDLVINFEVNGTPCTFTVDVESLSDSIIKDLLMGETEEDAIANYGTQD